MGFLGLALTTGTAAAQVCTASICDNDETTTTRVGEELGVGEENLPGGETSGQPGAGESEVLGETASVGGAAAPAPEGNLPLTGGDVAGLVLIGAAAIGAGAFMMRRNKTTA